MDRPELRFRILFEYYQELHSEESTKYSASNRIRDLDVSEAEKRAAEMWLIESNYVEGRIGGNLGSTIPTTYIIRINNHGIDFVECVMDVAFTEIANDIEIPETKLDRIKKFAAECLNNPATSEMCKATYKAIVKHMNSFSSTLLHSSPA